MSALDGNAIAGQLAELFGTDMTTAQGSCAHCGAAAQIAELAVYTRAPGAVARCRSCGQVVMVLVSAHGRIRASLNGFQLPAAPDAHPMA